jgi:hypothetical protein
MTNKFLGLARGAFPRDQVTVINAIAAAAIFNGDAVELSAPGTDELRPRVTPTTGITDDTYGIVVGGDADGVYSDDGTASSPDNSAATAAGQTVEVCTQGRCLARVDGSGSPVTLGDELGSSTTAGVLELAIATHRVIARALQPSSAVNDIILVDVQREGILA